MVSIFVARSSLEKDALLDSLTSHGLQIQIIPRSRDYASIVAGTAEESFEFFVESVHEKTARKIIEDFVSSHEKHESRSSSKKPARLAPIIIFSICGFIVLPVIFNLVATENWYRFIQQNNRTSQKMTATIFLGIGWIGVFFHFKFWLWDQIKWFLSHFIA